MVFPVNQVHGVSFPGQSLTGGLNFYTVRTLVNISPTVTGDKTDIGVFDQSTADLTNTAQQALDYLVQTISLRAQPVIFGRVVVTQEAKSGITDLPAAAALTGPNVTVYTVKFAIEHDQAWEVNGNNPSLEESLNGIGGFVFAIPSTNNNVSITLDTLLS